jgi:hypothetical protein
MFSLGHQIKSHGSCQVQAIDRMPQVEDEDASAD